MSFDAIAPYYRWLERVTAGPLLQRCRTEFLHELKDARNILLLGEGRGRFLMELLRQNPEAHITCVDASARMLELTRSELVKRGLLDRSRPSSSCSAVGCEDEKRGRISRFTEPLTDQLRFTHADVFNEDWGCGSERYDAIASHFFLDCFPPHQLARICETIAAGTSPGAPWLISDFRLPDRGWRRLRARWILWGMYRFFRIMTALPASRLTDPDPLLKSAGFRLRTRAHFNHGLLHSDIWVKA